jgi:hypothetical protein
MIKKIIAKEFLILLTSFFLVVLSLLYPYFYNTYQEYKNKELLSILLPKIKEIDSLQYQYFIKDKKKFELFSDYWRWEYSNNLEKLFDFEAKDSAEKRFWINLKYLSENNKKLYNIWKNKVGEREKKFFRNHSIRNELDLKNFVINNTITSVDKKNYDKGVEIEIQLENIKRIKRKYEKRYDYKKWALISTFYILLPLFPIRYLIISIIWSIKTIKS